MAMGLIGRKWLAMQRWCLLRVGSLARRQKETAPHLQVGVRGEFEALFHLRGEGYTVVDRRWKSPELRGDIDLVGWDGDCLCFVEVKTRTARDFMPAETAVDGDKVNMLRDMARAYLRRIPREERGRVPVRFDLVSVYLKQDEPRPEFELFRDAFGWR
jgi:putative endonuclease